MQTHAGPSLMTPCFSLKILIILLQKCPSFPVHFPVTRIANPMALPIVAVMTHDRQSLGCPIFPRNGKDVVTNETDALPSVGPGNKVD